MKTLYMGHVSSDVIADANNAILKIPKRTVVPIKDVTEQLKTKIGVGIAF